MTKNAILQMKVESVLQDIMLRTGADNVIVDSTANETLATRLGTIASSISNLDSPSVVDSKISTAISNLIDGAPETYDTLKEIAEYIASDKTAMEALNSAIGNKVSKVEGKGLSANDFTDALLTKLNEIATGATKVEGSTTNGNIKINGTETTVYTHPTTAGNKHIPSGGKAGQILGYSASGTAAWEDKKPFVRCGDTTPTDLSDNEIFIKFS